MRQTAVEWLEKALKLENYPKDGHIQQCIKKAKQMEKEQIVKAYENTNSMAMYGEQYYNETFKSE